MRVREREKRVNSLRETFEPYNVCWIKLGVPYLNYEGKEIMYDREMKNWKRAKTSEVYHKK